MSQPYCHPASLPRSLGYSMHINGELIEVLHTDVADFAICAPDAEDFPIEVHVAHSQPIAAATIHPAAREITASIADDGVHFKLDHPEKISLAIPGLKPFYLFIHAPETNPPHAGDPSVVTFPVGEITEVSVLTLEEGQTLYLPGGAVLKGRVEARGKSGIRICGHGILDGGCAPGVGSERPLILLERCTNALVEDITMVRPSGWMLVLAACTNTTVRNLKEIGEVVCSDGIDVVGSRDVLIEDCFLHNNDDCVVIKAITLPGRFDGREDVGNVLVRRCTLANWHAGNAMEVGHELSTDRVSNITFSDIDVLHVHGHGAVFSLHNNDRALVENILFENIRIEHCWDRLIDFRISKSQFSTDNERGWIRRVVLRNIDWTCLSCNSGYTVSLIGGWDSEHLIEDVTIENFRINGRRVLNLDELDIHSRHCRNLLLK